MPSPPNHEPLGVTVLQPGNPIKTEMGFLNKLFGNKYQELHDEQLGVFRKLSNNGSIIIWTGTADFLNSAVTIFIAGTETQLDENEKIINA